MDSLRLRITALVGAALLITCLAASSAFGSPQARAAAVCPGVFEVLHNDRIGGLQIPKGDYKIRTKHISCRKAVRNFRKFLNRPQGDLPDNWKVWPRKRRFVNRVKGLSFRISPV
jgi:hypothetical protein